MPSNTRNLIAVLLWTIAGFIAINHLTTSATLNDWWLPLLLFGVGLVLLLPLRRAATSAAAPVESVPLAAPVLPTETHRPAPEPVPAAPLARDSDAVVLTSPPLDAPASVLPTMNTRPDRSVTQKMPSEPAGEVEEALAEVDEVNIDEPMTEERSDAIAAMISTDQPIEDSIENINIDSTITLEETGELSSPPADSIGRDAPQADTPSVPDDLKRIEGIGPKMANALAAAGIDTFAKLSQSSEETIRAAIDAAGMRFAPSVPTWPRQAAYAAQGDWDGLKAYQDTLKAGRE